METIFVSPHYDDVIYSCGGLIAQKISSGQKVAIWTLCSAAPEKDQISSFARSLHDRWQLGHDVVEARLEEDRQAARLLGVDVFHVGLLDCIYRQDGQGNALYASEEAIFGEIHPLDLAQIDFWKAKIQSMLPEQAQLIAPLAVGHHVDHRYCRKILEKFDQLEGYYLDVPYIFSNLNQYQQYLPAGVLERKSTLSDNELSLWQEAIWRYQSQRSSFWPSKNVMKDQIESYYKHFGAAVVYQKR